MCRSDVRYWQDRTSWCNLVISGCVRRLPRRDLLQLDGSFQLHVVFRRLDYPRSWIDVLFPPEGLSSGHMEDYG